MSKAIGCSERANRMAVTQTGGTLVSPREECGRLCRMLSAKLERAIEKPGPQMPNEDFQNFRVCFRFRFAKGYRPV